MKRILALAMALAMSLSLIACGGGDKSGGDKSSGSGGGSSSSQSDTSSSEDSGGNADKQDDAILGAWDNDEHEISLVFEADGTFTMLDTAQSHQGTYQLDGTDVILTATVNGTAQTEEGTYDPDGDTLTFTWDKSTNEKFTLQRADQPSYAPAN